MTIKEAVEETIKTYPFKTLKVQDNNPTIGYGELFCCVVSTRNKFISNRIALISKNELIILQNKIEKEIFKQLRNTVTL